jgi:hypothetical protein
MFHMILRINKLVPVMDMRHVSFEVGIKLLNIT